MYTYRGETPAQECFGEKSDLEKGTNIKVEVPKWKEVTDSLGPLRTVHVYL